MPTTFVLVHGAWSGGWCYARVATLLRSRGHTVFTPTRGCPDARSRHNMANAASGSCSVRYARGSAIGLARQLIRTLRERIAARQSRPAGKREPWPTSLPCRSKIQARSLADQ